MSSKNWPLKMWSSDQQPGYHMQHLEIAESRAVTQAH